MQVVHYCTSSGTDVYQNWLDSLPDQRVKVAISRRIDRAAAGNFGDHKFCRDGVSEMRIDLGPGYRVYYFQHRQMLIVLLSGGDKRTQNMDISAAIAYREDFLHRMEESL